MCCHVWLQPSVAVTPGQSLSRFPSRSLLPHTMKVRVQRDIWVLAIKTALFGLVWFTYFFFFFLPIKSQLPVPKAEVADTE